MKIDLNSRIRVLEIAAGIAGFSNDASKNALDEVSSVYRTLLGLVSDDNPVKMVGEVDVAVRYPSVDPSKSYTDDSVTCLVCGREMVALTKHIRMSHGMEDAQYRKIFGLAHDHPLVAPNYSRRRSDMAKENGLGKSRSERHCPLDWVTMGEYEVSWYETSSVRMQLIVWRRNGIAVLSVGEPENVVKSFETLGLAKYYAERNTAKLYSDYQNDFMNVSIMFDEEDGRYVAEFRHVGIDYQFRVTEMIDRPRDENRFILELRRGNVGDWKCSGFFRTDIDAMKYASFKWHGCTMMG